MAEERVGEAVELLVRQGTLLRGASEAEGAALQVGLPARLDRACLAGDAWLTPGLLAEAPAVALCGMPGVGKSTHLAELARRLAGPGSPVAASVLVDCADARLAGAGGSLPVLAADAFFRLNPRLRREPCAFLLDNVDRAPGWDEGAARVRDVYGARFVVACRAEPAPPGSNGSPAPAGRLALALPCAVRRLRPFSLAQYAACRRASSSPGADAGGPGAEAAWLAEEYLACGGLPGAVLADPLLRAGYLQGLALAAAGGSPDFVAWALGRAGGTLPVTRAAAELAGRGVRLARASMAEQLGRMERAGLLSLEAPLGCDDPGRSRLPRTAFAGDVGLAAAFAPPGPEALEALMRNAVYLYLRETNPGCEVRPLRIAAGRFADLAVARDGRVLQVVQVADESAGGRAVARALATLGRAMLVAGLGRATLVTRGTPGSYPAGPGGGPGEVSAVPLGEFLLG